MKAITIKQPWADLIVSGAKDVENRTWPTRYRGPVLIHASRKLCEAEMQSAEDFILNRRIVIPRIRRWYLKLGSIIGIAEIIDCVDASQDRDPSPWFVGPYGFFLRNARRVQPFACRGSLGLWECDHIPEILPY